MLSVPSATSTKWLDFFIFYPQHTSLVTKFTASGDLNTPPTQHFHPSHHHLVLSEQHIHGGVEERADPHVKPLMKSPLAGPGGRRHLLRLVGGGEEEAEQGVALPVCPRAVAEVGAAATLRVMWSCIDLYVVERELSQMYDGDLSLKR